MFVNSLLQRGPRHFAVQSSVCHGIIAPFLLSGPNGGCPVRRPPVDFFSCRNHSIHSCFARQLVAVSGIWRSALMTCVTFMVHIIRAAVSTRPCGVRPRSSPASPLRFAGEHTRIEVKPQSDWTWEARKVSIYDQHAPFHRPPLLFLRSFLRYSVAPAITRNGRPCHDRC